MHLGTEIVATLTSNYVEEMSPFLFNRIAVNSNCTAKLKNLDWALNKQSTVSGTSCHNVEHVRAFLNAAAVVQP